MNTNGGWSTVYLCGCACMMIWHKKHKFPRKKTIFSQISRSMNDKIVPIKRRPEDCKLKLLFSQISPERACGQWRPAHPHLFKVTKRTDLMICWRSGRDHDEGFSFFFSSLLLLACFLHDISTAAIYLSNKLQNWNKRGEKMEERTNKIYASKSCFNFYVDGRIAGGAYDQVETA